MRAEASLGMGGKPNAELVRSHPTDLPVGRERIPQIIQTDYFARQISTLSNIVTRRIGLNIPRDHHVPRHGHT